MAVGNRKKASSAEGSSHYHILSQLGSGGMGKVYLAEDTKLGRKVALKFLPDDLSRDGGRIQRFELEARAASALNHPNILTIYEVGVIDGKRFISTEFVDGKTLRSNLAKETFSFDQILDFSIQIASALSAAHGAHIVHRDIKPENLMIRSDGLVKILDFGLAKLLEDQDPSAIDNEAATRALMKTQSGVIVGTVNYMSPEQARNKNVDGRTDIWSLGCVMYEMIAGRTPFYGDTDADRISSILNKDPVPLSGAAEDVPARLEEIVEKCLEKNVDERYQTSRDLLIDLRRLRRKLQSRSDLERAHPTTEVDSDGHASPARTSSMPESFRGSLGTSSKDHPSNVFTRHKLSVAIIFVAALLLAASTVYVYRTFPKPVPFQTVSVTKFTSTGSIRSVQISPDGENLAGVVGENGKRSIRIWDVATKSSVPVVPPTDSWLALASFSLDGKFLYYYRSDNNFSSDVYEIARYGGLTKKILNNTISAALSQDGKRWAFVRFGPGERSLFTANADGTNERLVFTRHGPGRIMSDGPLGQVLSWSPDGEKIVFMWPVDSVHKTLGEISVESGSIKPITDRKWTDIFGVAWLPTGEGIIFAAQDEHQSGKIWFISYPGGEIRNITSEPANLGVNGLSITANSKTIAALKQETFSNVFTAPIDDLSKTKPADEGADLTLPRDFSWTPDGRIAYGNYANGNSDIWIMNSDGSGQVQLTNDPADDNSPSVSPDGRIIVFASKRSGESEIWRMNSDGSDQKQLTNESGANYPNFSPDGQWVIYAGSAGTQLRKISINGGEPIVLNDRHLDWITISPASGRIAGVYQPDENSPYVIAVFSPEGGSPLQTFTIPDNVRSGALQWTRDDRSIIYRIKTGIWSQPLDGGPPKQIADFSPDEVMFTGMSRDGKTLVFTKGKTFSDVVLITDADRK